MENGEYLFGSASKKLVYALVRISPDLKIADKNASARKYTFLPRIGSDIRRFCGDYAKKLEDVKNEVRKAAIIPFRPSGKTFYSAVIKEENGCLLMIFHPLLMFVGTNAEQSKLEKAVASCAEKLRLSTTVSDKEKPRFPSSDEFLLASCFSRMVLGSEKASARLVEMIKLLNFKKIVRLVITGDDRVPTVFVEFSKLLYAFAEIVSFAGSLSSGAILDVTANFGENFMTVVVSGSSEHRVTEARKLYFDIFSAVMHCMGVGARILKTRENSFEVAISVPYEAPPRFRDTDTCALEVLEKMFETVLEFYGSIDI